MRIVDTGRGVQRFGLNLYVTREDAQPFLEKLRDFLDGPSGPDSRVDLVDGCGAGQEAYRTRRLVLFKIDPKHAKSDGWPPEFLNLIRDDEGKTIQVSLIPPHNPS